MLLKRLTLLVAVTIAYVIRIRSLPLPKFSHFQKCLKLKRASSYFANGIDLCYRLSLLFELVTAFTSSL